MDECTFRSLYDDIAALDASDGPARNVLEPKFAAQQQMQQLKTAVANAYKDAARDTNVSERRRRCRLALQQLCRCLAFVGRNMIEVDEADDGVVELQRAYRLAQLLCIGDDDDDVAVVDVDDIVPVALADIVATTSSSSSSSSSLCVPCASHHFAGCVEFVLVHNALGLYLSTARMSDARTVLERAEAVYTAWDAWRSRDAVVAADADAAAAGVTCSLAELRIDADGRLQQPPCEASVATAAKCAACVQCYEMTRAYTMTCFFLAQVYTSLQATARASRACHMTLYLQLRGKQAFATRTWATNALQLSGFYSSQHAYGKALHCLLAGQHVMPRDGDSDEEETTGLVEWAFGRYYVHYLAYYGQRLTSSSSSSLSPPQQEQQQQRGSDADDDAKASPSTDEFWLDFPDVAPPAQPQPAVTTFTAAREVFRRGNAHLKRALALHPFATSCVRHMEIRQDMVQLYSALAAFERSLVRRAAMVQRQLDLLEAMPSQLSFNAYPTLVRQLLFDVGTMYEELIRLHAEQRKHTAASVTAPTATTAATTTPSASPSPVLSDEAYNALVDRAVSVFTQFCDTWRDPRTHAVPEKLDEESRLPYFNALMHTAQLQTRYACASAKAEYDALGRAAALFARAVAFASNNPLADTAAQARLTREVTLAKEMAGLVALKQRNVLLAYQRSQAS